MIVALARGRIAAVRLNGDDELARTNEAEAESAGRRSTGHRAGSPQAAWTASWNARGAEASGGLVVCERQGCEKRPLGKRVDERGRVELGADVVSRSAQRVHDGDGACRRIEPDRIAGASAARRIVRQHKRESLLGRRLAAKPHPSRREIGDEGDPVGDRLMRDGAEFGRRVA